MGLATPVPPFSVVVAAACAPVVTPIGTPMITPIVAAVAPVVSTVGTPIIAPIVAAVPTAIVLSILGPDAVEVLRLEICGLGHVIWTGRYSRRERLGRRRACNSEAGRSSEPSDQCE
jgi:hypothetical protein